MNARISSSLPALISDPNPPRRFGHRKAIVAPPNSAVNTSSEATSERRKNSRRLTGLGAGGAGSPSRAAVAAASASRGRGARSGRPTRPRPRERQPEEDREQVDDHDHDDRDHGAAGQGDDGRHSS